MRLLHSHRRVRTLPRPAARVRRTMPGPRMLPHSAGSGAGAGRDRSTVRPTGWHRRCLGYALLAGGSRDCRTRSGRSNQRRCGQDRQPLNWSTRPPVPRPIHPTTSWPARFLIRGRSGPRSGRRRRPPRPSRGPHGLATHNRQPDRYPDVDRDRTTPRGPIKGLRAANQLCPIGPRDGPRDPTQLIAGADLGRRGQRREIGGRLGSVSSKHRRAPQHHNNGEDTKQGGGGEDPDAGRARIPTARIPTVRIPTVRIPTARIGAVRAAPAQRVSSWHRTGGPAGSARAKRRPVRAPHSCPANRPAAES